MLGRINLSITLTEIMFVVRKITINFVQLITIIHDAFETNGKLIGEAKDAIGYYIPFLCFPSLERQNWQSEEPVFCNTKRIFCCLCAYQLQWSKSTQHPIGAQQWHASLPNCLENGTK